MGTLLENRHANLSTIRICTRQLLLSGTFDRIPNLKYAVVECGSYWVGDTTPNNKTGLTENNLTRFDPISGKVTGRIVSTTGFFNLAVDPSSGVWGIGYLPGTTFARSIESAVAVRVDASSGQITGTIKLHHLPCCPQGSVGNGVAVGHGRLWIALDSP